MTNPDGWQSAPPVKEGEEDTPKWQWWMWIVWVVIIGGIITVLLAACGGDKNPGLDSTGTLGPRIVVVSTLPTATTLPPPVTLLTCPAGTYRHVGDVCVAGTPPTDPYPPITDIPSTIISDTTIVPAAIMAQHDQRFPNCKKANEAGLGPYIRGEDPEYHWYKDKDDDGIVCD